MTLNPHVSLAFNGQCEEAFRFYERCLGGRIVSIFTWGKSPMAGDAPPGWAGKVMFASMTLDGTLISGSDVPPAHYEPPRGFELMIEPDDPVDAERLFHALAENGTTTMPIQQTFWAERFGMCVDRFGIPWMVNCAKPS